MYESGLTLQEVASDPCLSFTSSYCRPGLPYYWPEFGISSQGSSLIPSKSSTRADICVSPSAASDTLPGVPVGDAVAHNSSPHTRTTPCCTSVHHFKI